jgi:hypothetical protein
MALTDNNNGMVMPVSPMYGGGYGGNMGGIGFGGDWAWILLLLVLGGGWGGFGGFGMGGAGAMMGMGMMGMDYLYPWLNNSEHISDGFRDQQLSSQVSNISNAVTSGFGDVQNALCAGFGNVQNSLCGGFAGVNASINGAQNALAQQLYTNQISDLERSFAAQTANTQGLTSLQAQLANCCCENRAATADLKYTVATENCQDRYEAAQNTQGIISAITAGIQSIKDDLCQDRLDAERRENANLRSELMYARGQASQVAQTAQILAGQSAEIDGVYNRLKNCPVGTYNVCNPLTPVSGCTSCGCGSF